MEDANEGPEPCGGPQPVRDAPRKCGPLGAITVVGLLAGGAFMVATCPVQRTHGATRSARLKWEQRQAEVQSAIREADAQQESGHDNGEKL
jgi:hypothetical protein